jgi:hypothetical protein
MQPAKSSAEVMVTKSQIIRSALLGVIRLIVLVPSAVVYVSTSDAGRAAFVRIASAVGQIAFWITVGIAVLIYLVKNRGRR